VRSQDYQSGWCGTGDHQFCAGGYAGARCACPCHGLAQPADVTGKPEVSRKMLDTC